MTDLTPLNANNTDNPITKIAIIGGGLTGLFTATLLEQAFADTQDKSLQITIFEKSRSVGRLATRYRTDETTGKNWQWSFGAQFFTAKTASFSEFITPWLNSGLLQPWLARVVTLTSDVNNNTNTNTDSSTDDRQSLTIEPVEQWGTDKARFISTPKMTSWGRELANNLQQTTIKFKTRVAPLAKYTNLQPDEDTQLYDENGESLGRYDWVICTAPNEQAVELMADSGFLQQTKILQPKMLACYTLMLGWDNLESLPDALSVDSELAWDVAYPQDSILAKIFVEHQKPNHSELLPSVTIHADNDYSEAHVDDDIEGIKVKLLAAAKQALNWDKMTAPTQIDCHRWRYAATVIDKETKALGILVDTDKQWIVSGDWCAQGNIESAYRVAEDTVEVVKVF